MLAHRLINTSKRRNSPSRIPEAPHERLPNCGLGLRCLATALRKCAFLFRGRGCPDAIAFGLGGRSVPGSRHLFLDPARGAVIPEADFSGSRIRPRHDLRRLAAEPMGRSVIGDITVGATDQLVNGRTHLVSEPR